MSKLEKVRKRDGRLVSFDQAKIADAIFAAARSVGGEDRLLAEELASAVAFCLEKKFDAKVPDIEDIQDMVEKILIETGHAKTAKAYILYREKRAQVRQSIKVRKSTRGVGESTDISLLVDPGSRDELLPWDKTRIQQALIKEADLDPYDARKIAGTVEAKILNSGLSRVSTSLIRELVDNELFDRGFSSKLAKQSVIGMPKYDLDQLIFSRSKENSNITANNPEAINLAIAETTLKQYALQEVFSREVAEAHLSGSVHLHDLGYPTRVYCSSHSLEYLKKYGLRLENLDTKSAPAKHARTLTGHLNTFLASMQAYYAGALGVGYINVLYAPYVEAMSYEEMRQEAQHMIFSGSQSAFSRGGQTLFLDFNIHTGVPRYMQKNPAIGPSGRLTGKTYGEYGKVAAMFTRALLDVWREGDSSHRVFAFPKCDFHVNHDTFNDPVQLDLLKYACQIASENGVPYFVFDRDEVTLSACCRLRTAINDNYMLEHLESMRFCGFQNITINLPQAAYKAGRGNYTGLVKEIHEAMEIACKAHLEKRRFIKLLISGPQMPLWEIGKPAADGLPYVDLDKATYIIGLVGLNECVEYFTGQELHESDDALKMGLRIVGEMNVKAHEFSKRHNLKFSLEESPAESATRRLAKIDLRNFAEAREVLKGDVDQDEFYYTNSVHLRASAPVDMITRIRLQSKFHGMIESGAIIHAFVGERLPSADSIFNLVKKAFFNTLAAQITISPEFTVCTLCNNMVVGSRDDCPRCGARNLMNHVSRRIDYKTEEPRWNVSTLSFVEDRSRRITPLSSSERRDYSQQRNEM
ncbi:MAG TPA: anaerobic ribonucleoside-triphosphate reductase [Planctomycetota bacterium]|nr:anaerobic ribonucleoside-triphosphate reductase [Planctomycetota bacterium]